MKAEPWGYRRFPLDFETADEEETREERAGRDERVVLWGFWMVMVVWALVEIVK